MSRRAAPRALVLLFTAAMAAGQLSTGLVPVAPAATARAGTGNFPQFDGGPGIPTQTTFYAAAGIANIADPSGPANPDPATVTAQNGTAGLEGAALLTSDLTNTQLGTTLVSALRLQTLPVDLPLSSIPLDRASSPHTWQEMLAGTALAGIPLQSITFKQVWQFDQSTQLPGFRSITLAEVNWSSSVLATIPLTALAMGGTDLASVDPGLQPGENAGDTNLQRWCALFNAVQAGSCTSASSLSGQTAIGATLLGAPLRNIPLRNIPLRNIAMTASPLRNIPLRNIATQVAPLRNIPLRNILLDSSGTLTSAPLRNIPLRNIFFDTAGNLTASPLRNIPLRNIFMASTPLRNIPLRNIDLTASPLRNIPLRNIDFSVAPLRNIPLRNINLSSSGIGAIPLRNINFASAPLRNIPLRNINIANSPLRNIPLRNIALAGAPLRNIPLRNIDFSAAPLRNIPLRNIADTSAIYTLALDQILWSSAGLASAPLSGFSFASGPLSTIALSDTADPASIAACWPGCSTATLGSLTAAQFATGGTLAAIGASGFAGHGTLADLLNARTATSTVDPTLGDLRLDVALAGAPAVTINDLLTALINNQPDPILGDLAQSVDQGGTGLVDAPLGSLGLDLLTDTGMTVSDLVAALTSSTPDVLLGDLRVDQLAADPAINLAQFIGSLSSQQPDVTLGDLRLDAASGVDALVLNAVVGFLLAPADLDGYLLDALNTWTDSTGHQITLGELGFWQAPAGSDITLGQLAQYLGDTVTVEDVLLGLVSATDFPYENFPVSSLGLDEPGRPILSGSGTIASPQNTYTIPLFNVGSTDTDPADLMLSMPEGSKYPTTLLTFNGPSVVPSSQVIKRADGTQDLLVHLPPILVPTSQVAYAQLRVSWYTGLSLQGGGIDAQILDPSTGQAPYVDPAYPFNPYFFAFDLHPISDASEPNSPTDTSNPAAGVSHVPTVPVNSNGCSSLDTSCTGKAAVYIDDLVPGFIGHDVVGPFISSKPDVDWYRLPNVRAGSRITADLTNLPVDADLVLYAPAGTNISPTVFPSSQFGLPGTLVEDPALGVGAAAQALSAQALSDLNLDTGYVDPATNQFVPPLTPVSISQHRGTDNESVGIVAPVSGTYTVAVSGYTTAANLAVPYLLRTRVTTPAPEGTCTPRSGFSHATTGVLPTVPDGANALILTNMSRLSATYTDITSVTNALGGLTSYLGGANATGVVPVVVPLDADPGVQAAYQAWDDNPCSVAATNGVAKAITSVIATMRAANPNANFTSVTIVGGDDIIPMGRVPDLTRISNEAEYASTFGDTLNPIAAAEAGSYTLTDDLYGDTSPTSLGDAGSLFVPRMAVGRLVETPAEIAGQLNSFATNNGVLDTSSALVAGYDFLADGAQAVADRLNVNGRSVDSSLIDGYGATSPWTKDTLLSKLFPGGAAPMVDSINAHYSHNALLSSAGNTAAVSDAPLTTTELVAKNTADQLRGRVLFTMGCHAGLAVPDSYVAGSSVSDIGLDWAQTLSHAGVSVYVANTGFGIGDTVSVAYTERLMGLYARLLDGTLTAGQALAYAKQAYYGSLGAVGVYDLKILQQTEFYGLPFWHLTTVSPSAAAATAATVGLRLSGISPSLISDGATGLQAQDLSFDQTTTLTPHTSARGKYWTVGDEAPQVVQYRPVQPQTSRPVTVSGLQAHGALITALTSHDQTINPALAMPTANQAAATGEASTSDVAWPSRLATVTNFVSPGGPAQNVVLVAGQYQGTSAQGTERLFDTAGVRVLYAAPTVTDFTEPVIASVAASGAGSVASFGVQASDAAGPVKRVVVGYQDFDGSWKFIDLTSSDGINWSGSGATSRAFSGSDVVTAFVQVVDAAGNVAVAAGKAIGVETRITDHTAPTITTSVSPAPDASGWIKASSATVTFTCDDGSGSGVASCPIPVTVTGDGVHDVSGTAADNAGNASSATVTVKLDGTKPEISASADPAGWSNATSATVTFTCSDGASGLAADACPAPVVVTAEGATAVSGAVTDIAGNTASASVTVRLDRTAPTISAHVSPTPNAAGWNNSTVTVHYTCSDNNTLPQGACPADATVNSDGVHTLDASVTDVANNTTSVSTTVSFDKTAPVVTISGTAPTFACSTSDATSGVAQEATLSTSTQRVNGIPMTTATCGGALDNAGNAGSKSAPAYVAKITFSGFLDPVNAPPTINTGAAGKTFPIKFKLSGVDGLDITVLPAVKSTTYKSVSCTTMTGTEDPLTTVSTSASGLTYDTVAKQYIYTWKSPSTAGCYVFTLTLADNSAYTANFKLK